MMAYLELFFTFFKVGLFTIGGGLAAIPLLQEYALSYGWVDNQAFADMIAISQSTPGPIGINMATYVGFEQFGVLGSIVATVGMVSPSIIIITIIAKFLTRFSKHPMVISVLGGIRPAVVGIILAAAYSIAVSSLYIPGQTRQMILSFVLLVGFAILNKLTKWHPALYILIAAVVGIIVF